jgi:Flp pilus assembly protein TadD
VSEHRPTADQSRASVRFAAAIFIGALVAFARAPTFPWIVLDDPDYVTKNTIVQRGLTLDGIGWAWRSVHASNWHPLTWLSHMIDVDLFGDWAGGHHLSSVVLHAAAAVLLFAALERATKRPAPSAAVAAIWAVHPLRVESVAWVAERKDVLSTFFFMLTLLLYVAYAERPTKGRGFAVLGSFAVGLCAKPMLVTLPAVLLLLDAWPLGRLTRANWRRAVAEKVPLFALSAAVAVITMRAQAPLASHLSLGTRLGAAAVACAEYLRQVLVPVGLAPFYPRREHIGAAALAIAVFTLVGVTALAVREARRRPWLIMGWCWYLGTLVPVIGVVQVGMQGHADRYTYIPSVGILLAVVWAAADALPAKAARAIAIAAVLTGVAATIVQTGYWRDSIALFERAESVSGPTWFTDMQLVDAYAAVGNVPAAVAHADRALALAPENPQVQRKRADVLASGGRLTEAIEGYRRALGADPGDAQTQNSLCIALTEMRRVDEAIRCFRRAIELDPIVPVPHLNLGILLRATGDIAGAEREIATARRLAGQ